MVTVKVMTVVLNHKGNGDGKMVMGMVVIIRAVHGSRHSSRVGLGKSDPTRANLYTT